MKRDVLSRYECSPDGSILIDVAAVGVEDLYEDFDKSAPYIRRDLDQDLVDYLIDCARELGREPFSVRFTLAKITDERRFARIRRSVNVFFLYLAEKERQRIHQMSRTSFVLFCIGFAILFISVWVNQSLDLERSVLGNVFAEGLTVAAWVALWEALATFLVEWFPCRKNIELYQRLAHAKLIVRLEPMSGNVDSGQDTQACVP